MIGRRGGGMIFAVRRVGRVIGLHGRIPWHHPGDLARFKRVTMGSAVIMGRHTWDERKKPLPGRRNLLVSRREEPGVETFRDIRSAMAAAPPEQAIWFIGGTRIYEAAMTVADVIDVTYVPERIVDPEAVRFPHIESRGVGRRAARSARGRGRPRPAGVHAALTRPTS